MTIQPGTITFELTFADLSSPLSVAHLQFARGKVAIGYAKFYSRSHHAVIRVYDNVGNVIETDEHASDFKEW